MWVSVSRSLLLSLPPRQSVSRISRRPKPFLPHAGKMSGIRTKGMLLQAASCADAVTFQKSTPCCLLFSDALSIPWMQGMGLMLRVLSLDTPTSEAKLCFKHQSDLRSSTGIRLEGSLIIIEGFASSIQGLDDLVHQPSIAVPYW